MKFNQLQAYKRDANAIKNNILTLKYNGSTKLHEKKRGTSET
jgi:hypothetical protein